MSSAVQRLIQCLNLANAEQPQLAVINTIVSCEQLLRLTLQKAGSEYAFVGKASRMDGAGARPSWLTPHLVPCVRVDGQIENVMIDMVSMDACWHLPTMKQIKVIAHSTANEPGPHEKGPARLSPYEIPEFNTETGNRQYRWHNPPIPQPGSGSGVGAGPMPPMPPAPPPLPIEAHRGYETIGGDAAGMAISRAMAFDYERANGRGLDKGCGAWMFRSCFVLLTNEVTTPEAAVAKYRPEWCRILGVPVIPIPVDY